MRSQWIAAPRLDEAPRSAMSSLDISLRDTALRFQKWPKNWAFGGAVSKGVYLGQVAIYCRVSTDDQCCQRQGTRVELTLTCRHGSSLKPKQEVPFVVPCGRPSPDPMSDPLKQASLARNRRRLLRPMVPARQLT